MKKGWQIKKIGDVCSLMTGGTPSKSKAEYFGGEVRWLVSGDIHRGEILDCEGRITEAGMRNSNAKLLPLNSVMIALNGQGKTRGTVALLRTQATCNQSLVSIYPNDPETLLPEFLFANLHGRYQEIRHMTGDSGNDRRGLNMGLVKSIEIPIAPLSDQQRIVGILDEAFEGIATAKANAEKNLQNAHALFESQLQSAFTPRSERWKQKTLAEIATTFGRGKSRHRPRNEPKLYGGKYPFIQTGDIRNADHFITEYSQTYSEAGLAQSKLWPTGTICITIAANIAETGILSFDACFPDSVIGLVANPKVANVGYVEYLLQSFRVRLQAKGKGSAQANINVGTFENERFPFPPVNEQIEITAKLEGLREETQRLASVYRRKLTSLEALKKSLLHQAFTGQLTEKSQKAVVIPFPKKIPTVTPTDLHAGVLAIAYQLHEKKHKQQVFGHVKAEKIAHLIEARLGIDLGRTPIKDAAGPNDYPHLKAVEHRAKMAGFFVFQGSKKTGYQFVKRQSFDALVEKTRGALGEHNQALDDLLELLAPMNTQQAEIFATVYAAWNNLLLDGLPVTDESIVFEARENWHADKLAIPREKFFKAILWMRDKEVIPDGTGKKVNPKPGKAK